MPATPKVMTRYSNAAAYAGEVWCHWFETLLRDAEAKMTLPSSILSGFVLANWASA
jgi:hypothetical protein